MVSCLAYIKTDVEVHETIQNCGLVYSIDSEKLHRLILQEQFVQNIPGTVASDQMFISGEIVFLITLTALQQK